MRDKEIRAELFASLLKKFYSKTENNRVFNELEVSLGKARVDIAVVNGKFHGFEIKSPADTLKRLDNQIVNYNRVFDVMHLVTWNGFISEAEELIPNWWGIIVANENRNGRITFTWKRRAKRNPSPDAAAWLELLWSTELKAFARTHGFRAKDLTGSRKVVAFRVAQHIDNKLISLFVRDTIRGRPHQVEALVH